MAKKSKSQFPPLVEGSKVDLRQLEFLMNDSSIMAEERVPFMMAMAAAEWIDVDDKWSAEGYGLLSVRRMDARDAANKWHAFRRENCKKEDASWFCSKCKVEVYQVRCLHCGKSRHGAWLTLRRARSWLRLRIYESGRAGK
jgi:hypothetical protein